MSKKLIFLVLLSLIVFVVGFLIVDAEHEKSMLDARFKIMMNHGIDPIVAKKIIKENKKESG